MPPVAVVTDSTHYLPRDLVAAAGVHEVSLYVTDDGSQRRELEIGDVGAFYQRLRTARDLPTTSQPSIGDFLAVLEPLAAAGRDGAGVDAVVERTREAARGMRFWFAVETLEYLRRGGRIGPARAWLGSALKVKPILTLDGEITPVERVRTSGRAFERMVDYMRARRDDGADGWVVQHAGAPDVAERLVERGREVFATEPLFVSEIGPVIGAHIGPGLVGTGGLATARGSGAATRPRG